MHSSINADQLLRGLALAVARNQVGANRPIHEIAAGEGLTQTEYDAISANPQFKRYVDSYAADLTENGYSFAAKSKVLAEDLLPTAYRMARDPETPAAVRAKIIENLVEWADLKPKKTADTVATAYGISIVINGAPTMSATQTVIDATPTTPVITLPAAPVLEPKAPSGIVFDEPESYEYAGEDIIA